MPKVLLIQPSQYGAHNEIIRQKRLYLPGLVFPLLAALTPENWEIEVKIEVIEDVDFETDADIVGIGTMGHSVFRAFDLAREFRKRGKKVFIGGYMASLIPEMSLEHVDSVIVGDAEYSYPRLLKDFENGGIEKIYKHPLDSLKGLPVPKYEIFRDKKIGFMLPVQAGRGCSYRCTFCSISCLYRGKYLSRPADEVIRDITRIKELGYRHFYMIDDNIVSDPAFLEELCRLIKPLGMTWATQCTMNLAKNKKLLKQVSDAGCRILSLGIENITQEGLDALNKSWLKVNEHEKLISAFRDAGIMVSAELMIGTDSDTPGSLVKLFDFIMKTRLPLLRVYFLTPIPGTEFFDQMKSEKRLIHEDFRLYTASNAVHYSALITPEELTDKYNWLNSRIFSWGSIMKRTLLNPDMLNWPAGYFYAFGVNIHYRKYIKQGNLPIIV
jgi:radical SAM superfamily enzyme YgiQ (UPF0313 family)